MTPGLPLQGPQPGVTALAMTAALALLSALQSPDRDHQPETFSNPQAIEQRANETRTELQQIAAGADPSLREQLERLAALCHYHPGAARIAADHQQKRSQAAQAAQAWA